MPRTDKIHQHNYEHLQYDSKYQQLLECLFAPNYFQKTVQPKTNFFDYVHLGVLIFTTTVLCKIIKEST